MVMKKDYSKSDYITFAKNYKQFFIAIRFTTTYNELLEEGSIKETMDKIEKNGNELVEYYQEYKTLADNLKNTKKALGLRAGIENEVVYDKAESNLYKYSSVGKNGGAYTSLSRALTDPEGEDAAAWNMQKEESAKKLKTGAIAAGGGIVGGIGGNALMNTDMIKNITSKFKGSGTDADTDSE